MARRANVGAAGWNAAAYFSADKATAAIIVDEKGDMVNYFELYDGLNDNNNILW